VTNPPLDAIREELVTSNVTNIGFEKDLFQETPEHARLLKLKQPILTNKRLQQIKELQQKDFSSAVIPIHFELAQGGAGLKAGIERLCAAAEKAVSDGATILILSDRGAGRAETPIPALLATSAVHHHLIRQGLRTRCGLVIETAEAREVHHFCCLFGYGAGAVNPYLAYETIEAMREEGQFTGPEYKEELTSEKVENNYIKAVYKGVLKVMSKMGISTLQSYRGAQVFEAIGLNSSVVSAYFTGTPSRIEGSGLDELAEEIRRRNDFTYPSQQGSGWRLPVASPWGTPPAQSSRHRPVADVDQGSRQGGLQEVRRDGEQPEPPALHAARIAGIQGRPPRHPGGRGRAVDGNRQAVQDRGDVLRFHLPRGARDSGHRHEPHWRQEQLGRRRRGVASLCARRQR
jgi:hypothetical protein